MDLITQKQFNEGELYDAYKHLGCIYDADTKTAVFRVYAPRAISVNVVGDFNDWNNSATVMERNEAGIYEVTVNGVEVAESEGVYTVEVTEDAEIVVTGVVYTEGDLKDNEYENDEQWWK